MNILGWGKYGCRFVRRDRERVYSDVGLTRDCCVQAICQLEIPVREVREIKRPVLTTRCW